ncbi:MAG: hypothetical protein P4L22_01700 [Candidatus Babeliales bacterium]|nr:hypothetical protein [Candidatus Babeliales bacterium]
MDIDLIIKVSLTIFVIILFPVYKKNYGLRNFLWLSDIGLFLTLFALWFKSPLLISIAVVGILPLEIIWNIDFFVKLLSSYSICGLSNYMFDSKYSYALRSLSLFHVFMPLIWVYYLSKWGYDIGAFQYWLFLFWIILTVCYLFTSPKENINWVFMPAKSNWDKISPLQWLLILMVVIPVFISLPMHFILKHL